MIFLFKPHSLETTTLVVSWCDTLVLSSEIMEQAHWNLR